MSNIFADLIPDSSSQDTVDSAQSTNMFSDLIPSAQPGEQKTDTPFWQRAATTVLKAVMPKQPTEEEQNTSGPEQYLSEVGKRGNLLARGAAELPLGIAQTLTDRDIARADKGEYVPFEGFQRKTSEFVKDFKRNTDKAQEDVGGVAGGVLRYGPQVAETLYMPMAEGAGALANLKNIGIGAGYGGVLAGAQPRSEDTPEERGSARTSAAIDGAIAGGLIDLGFRGTVGVAGLAGKAKRFFSPESRLADNLDEALGSKKPEAINDIQNYLQDKERLKEKGVDLNLASNDVVREENPRLQRLAVEAETVPTKIKNAQGEVVDPGVSFQEQRVGNQNELNKNLKENYDTGASETSFRDFAKQNYQKQLASIDDIVEKAQAAADGNEAARQEISDLIDTKGLTPEQVGVKVDNAVKGVLSSGQAMQSAKYAAVAESGARINAIDVTNEAKRLTEEVPEYLQIMKRFNAKYARNETVIPLEAEQAGLSAKQAVELNANLSKEINGAYRRDDKLTIDALEPVRSELRTAIENNVAVGEDFKAASASYKDWANTYLKRSSGGPSSLGVFKNEVTKGTKEMAPSESGDRFITNEPETITEFKNLVPESENLTREKLYSDLAGTYKNKLPDKKSFDKFLTNNEVVLSRFPALQDEFQALRSKVQGIKDPREVTQLIREAQKTTKAAKSELDASTTGVIAGTENPQSYVKKALGSEQAMKDTVATFKDNPDARESFEQAVFNSFRNEGDSGIVINSNKLENLLTPDSESERAMKALYGEDGVQGLRDYLKFVKQNRRTLNTNLAGRGKEPLDDTVELLANATLVQKLGGARAFSVMNVPKNLVSKPYNQKLYEVMKDPEALLKLLQLRSKDAGVVSRATKWLVEKSKSVGLVPKTVGILSGSDNEVKEPVAPEDETIEDMIDRSMKERKKKSTKENLDNQVQGVLSTNKTFNSAWNWLSKQEGGFVPNDSGAGPTNYGINSKANPDIDVKSLTPEKAKQVGLERYWKKIGADKLPPAVALVAFDGAFNQGLDRNEIQDLVDKSGGNPLKMIKLRRDMYRKIAQRPDKAENLSAWMGRMDSLEEEVKRLSA